MNQTVNKRKQSTVVRLFSQLKGQRVRLTVVAISIVIYEFQPFVLTFMMAKIERDRPGYNFIF